MSTVTEFSQSHAIPARTIRHWLKHGKLAGLQHVERGKWIITTNDLPRHQMNKYLPQDDPVSVPAPAAAATTDRQREIYDAHQHYLRYTATKPTAPEKPNCPHCQNNKHTGKNPNPKKYTGGEWFCFHCATFWNSVRYEPFTDEA